MIEVYGTRGIKQKAFSKVFKTDAQFDAWLLKMPRGITLHHISSETHQGSASTMADWRRDNPEPTHGCGHMQGRGAA